MAMLQLQTLRGSRDGALQASAAAMAQELAELRTAYRAAAPDAADAGDPYLFALSPFSRSDARAGHCASGCDAAGFAAAALAEWRARLQRELPGAQAVVCRDGSADPRSAWRCDDAADGPVVIKLSWRGSAPGASATPLMALAIGR
jgi:type IV pilus assembly protein PilV